MKLKALNSALTLLIMVGVVGVTKFQAEAKTGNCSSAYPDVCIAPPLPDLDCKNIPYRRFRVFQPDPHRFDEDKDGIGCERK